jgi:hypothetical protein
MTFELLWLNVRNRGQTGKELLVLSITGFDPSRTWARSNSRSAAPAAVPLAVLSLMRSIERGPTAPPPRFRTTQVWPKDLPAVLRQVLYALV